MENETEPHAIIASPPSLRALLEPRSRDLERDLRFSWFNCILSVFSFLLMLSDVPRTGLGVHDLSSHSPTEPDQLIVFGPYAYPVTTQPLQTTTNTTIANTPFWLYKYDSTSVSMRAVAKHLAIREWPACVTYDAKCDERGGIPPTALFQMIDSLIDRVKTHRDTQGRRGRLTLRTHYDWCDRLHSFAFPSFFPNIKPRTIQATHFDHEKLSVAQRHNSLCGSASRASHPLTCGESWTDFGRRCASTKPLCRNIGRVHSHVPAHLHKLLELYPNHTMDFILLEGVDDSSRSSITLQGYKNIDVVVLARVRKCTSTTNSCGAQCETVLVHDFRYEVVSLVINVRDWFWVTAILRTLGQLYAWIRVVFLLVGCYYATRADELNVLQQSYFGRLQLTVRTMFLLPSQVVVYGSLFPISCYLLAHLIDSAAVYEIMRLQFSTVMGVMSLDVIEILRVCAVSMRSLWLLAFVCHVFQRVATQCTWSPIHGVPGIPEFSLSFIASLTILAQVKYPSLRDSRVLSVEEIVPSLSRYHCNSMQSDSRYSFVSRVLFGTSVDYKCLALAVCVHIGMLLLFRLVNRVLPRWFPYESMLCTRTGAPYSADSLWPRSAVVVSWNGAFLAKVPSQKMYKTAPTPSSLGREPSVRCSDSAPLAAKRDRVVSVSPSPSFRVMTTAASQRFSTSFYRGVPRSRDDETLIFLMNLGVMTDPFSFLRLRVFPGPLIGLYTESRPHTQSGGGAGTRSDTSARLLLPLALATSSADIPIDWNELQLQLVVHTSELDWCDLLQCG